MSTDPINYHLNRKKALIGNQAAQAVAALTHSENSLLGMIVFAENGEVAAIRAAVDSISKQRKEIENRYRLEIIAYEESKDYGNYQS